jgi:succinate dehydrogenase / fumarate reductase membrane anchor subunit
MRLSGLLLLAMALFHLFYLYFWQPGGIDGISYQSIAARWTDPALGFTWRVFDLLLLVLGLAHGCNGIRQVIDGAVSRRGWRVAGAGILLLGYVGLVGVGAAIIFTL